MKLQKSANRDRKIDKRKHGMIVDGSSVKLISQIQRDKSKKIKREREE